LSSSWLGYWVSGVGGQRGHSHRAVSYTSSFAPWIAQRPGASALVTIAVVWVLTS